MFFMKRVLQAATLLAMFFANSSPAEEVLYLHCFRPTYGQKVVTDPKRSGDSSPATPPTAMVTLRVVVGVPFEVITKPYQGVSGRIDRENGALVAKFKGSFGSSSHSYSGAVEAEKVFDPKLDGFASAILPFRFVFSAHKEIEPFLKAQSELDAKKLEEATEMTKRNLEIHKARQEAEVKEGVSGE